VSTQYKWTWDPVARRWNQALVFEPDLATAPDVEPPDVDPPGGLSAGDHQTLRQLIHFIDEGPGDGFVTGAFKEVLPAASPFPTSVTWYQEAAKTHRLVSKSLSYTGAFPTAISWNVYAPDGFTVVHTVTDSIAYSGAFELSRTRAIL
jgi:hypothetical protein